jgi:phosphatidylglycerol lysyltransferase
MSDDRARLLELVRQHGRNLHSFMVLEPGLSLWFDATRDAAVAYAAHGGYWVAVGSPLCAVERIDAVTRAFSEAAQHAGQRAAFFGVSERFVGQLGQGFDALQVGQQPLWRPSAWPEVVRRAEKLRNRLRRAEKLGVSVRQALPAELAARTKLRSAMEAMVARWTQARALPPMGFMVTVELFAHAEARRYFIAQSASGKPVGFAVAVPIFGLEGWLIEDLVVDRDAPAGSTEALIDAAMRALADATTVSLGMVVLAGLSAPVETQRHPILTGLIRLAGRVTGWAYGFEGLLRFRQKLRPERWENVYVVAPGGVSWLTLRAVLMAFTGGWVPRFALRAVRRLVAQRWSGR